MNSLLSGGSKDFINIDMGHCVPTSITFMAAFTSSIYLSIYQIAHHTQLSARYLARIQKRNRRN